MRAARRYRSPAAAFDVVILQQIARQGMGEIPFLGMIEGCAVLEMGARWLELHRLG